MKITEYKRIVFDDWERRAQGTIRDSSSNLEIITKDRPTQLYLRGCLHRGDLITNPVAWSGDTYKLYSGAYKVIHLDDQSAILKAER